MSPPRAVCGERSPYTQTMLGWRMDPSISASRIRSMMAPRLTADISPAEGMGGGAVRVVGRSLHEEQLATSSLAAPRLMAGIWWRWQHKGIADERKQKHTRGACLRGLVLGTMRCLPEHRTHSADASKPSHAAHHAHLRQRRARG